MVLLSSITPNPNNPRVIKDASFKRLVKSIKEFPKMLGLRPMVVDEKMVLLGGNMRYEAIKSLGITEIPDNWIARADDLNEEEKQRFIIADNLPFGEWDMDKLANSFDVEKLVDWGMNNKELTDMINTPSEQDDAVPEFPKKAKCRIGDLWILGSHRLLCGDSANPDAMARLLGEDLPVCVFTDPPYGVSIGKKNVMLNSFQKAGRNLTDIESDDLTPEELEKVLLPIFVNIKNHISEDCTIFVTAPQRGELGMMMMMMQKACLRPRHVLIWKKNSPTFSMGRLDYDYAHEPILMTWGKKHKRPMNGKFRTSVWEIDKPRSSKEHPTMKPVELYVNAYLNNSEDNDFVFDPFAGSGPAAIAAEKIGRRARLIELSPEYCDVILSRWATFSGADPVREDGVKWSDLNG
jgi:DNA modification methylase